MNQTDYRVQLDVYNGPLELLLYLIRKEEVDIHDIPIARITAQYLAHVEMLRHVDIELIGDFLVMAATLMEIKSRMLNPQPAADATGEGGGDIQAVTDPRQQLVQQLLAYKQFKDAANDLQRRAQVEQLRFGRAAPPEMAGKAPLELEDINLFALIDAFNAIMASVGHSAFGHDVVFDETPIGLYQADILDRLEREGAMTLQAMFVGRTSRSEMIGLFLAMLELIRLKKIMVEQSEPLGDLRLRLKAQAPVEQPTPAADSTVSAAAASTPNGEPALDTSGPAAG